MVQVLRHTGLDRWRNSRLARAAAATAAFSFLFLLSPYCDNAEAAEAPPPIQKSVEGHGHSHDGPGHGNTCPSLDHTPPIPLAAVASPTAGVSDGSLIRVATSDPFAFAWWPDVSPRATPPPAEVFPLYLRYAHLLM